MAHHPKIGVHVSIAGGIDKAPERAKTEGCETFQCFTRSPQGGPAPRLTPELVANFKSEMARHVLKDFYIHAPYYINLASMTEFTRQSSIQVIREELERGSVLGACYVMAHVGSHSGQTLEAGIAKVISGLQAALENYQGETKFLIEISAGAGNVIGDTFEEVGAIVKAIKSFSGFGGICFDTCHAFASGYDFKTVAGARAVLEKFNDKIGLEFLALTHVNDSKTDLGGKRDRHEHISQGFIGERGLASLLQQPEFLKIDWLLETEPEGRKLDVEKLKAIRMQKT